MYQNYQRGILRKHKNILNCWKLWSSDDLALSELKDGVPTPGVMVIEEYAPNFTVKQYLQDHTINMNTMLQIMIGVSKKPPASS